MSLFTLIFLSLIGCSLTPSSNKISSGKLRLSGQYRNVHKKTVGALKKCNYGKFLSRIYDDTPFGEIIFEEHPSAGMTAIIGTTAFVKTARSYTFLEIKISQEKKDRVLVNVSDDRYLDLVSRAINGKKCVALKR